MRFVPICLALLLTLSGAVSLNAQQSSPSIAVPAGAQLLMTAQGRGMQIYSCTAGHWALKEPKANLLDSSGHKVGKHFAGPTWEWADGSQVRGQAIAKQPSPDKDSVAWLLVKVISHTGDGKLAAVSYIRRTDTHGGAAPDAGCTGGTKSVRYTATYSFYTGQ